MADYSVMLADRNLADEAALSSTGSWSAGLPLANLQALPLDKRARSSSASATDTRLTATWTTDQTVRALMIGSHNLTLAATVRIVLRNSGGTALKDVTVNAFANSFAGPRKPTAREIAHYPHQHFFYVFDANYSGVRSIDIYITDTANPDGFVEAGRFWVCLPWQPAVNMAYGLSLGWRHEGVNSERTIGGRKLGGTGYRYRAGRFTLQWLTPTEAMQTAFEMTGGLGLTGEVLVLLDPTNATDVYRLSFPANLAELNSVEWVQHNQDSMALSVEEII